MKQQIQSIALVIMITVITITLSCKKPEDSNTTKTKTELLTTGTWKRTAFIATPAYDWNADGTFDTNLLNTMFPCEKDNFDAYKTNGIIETNEGFSKCNPSDPQTWTANWIWTNNETKILFDGYDEYTMLELTETTLKYQSTFVENGITYTHVETYGH